MNLIKTLVVLLTLLLSAFAQLPQNDFAIGAPPVANTCNGVASEICIPTTCMRPEVIDPLLISTPTMEDFGADMNSAIGLAGDGG